MVLGSLEPLKIVVVDDDPLIRELIARCLALFGASVTLCENAFQGIIAVEEVRPDIALIDILMPGRNGLELMSQIRELEPEQGGKVQIIVTTGLRDPDLESEIQQAGFAYLAKPFTPIQLFNSVSQTLNSFSLPRRLVFGSAFGAVASDDRSSMCSLS
jgi:CheY-like chemotaxis protein